MKCVCGHDCALHMNYEDGCLHWFQDGCSMYTPDDGLDHGSTCPAPRSNDYPPNSRYSTPRNGWPVD